MTNHYVGDDQIVWLRRRWYVQLGGSPELYGPARDREEAEWEAARPEGPRLPRVTEQQRRLLLEQ